jgi:hypothetical protein
MPRKRRYYNPWGQGGYEFDKWLLNLAPAEGQNAYEAQNAYNEYARNSEIANAQNYAGEAGYQGGWQGNNEAEQQNAFQNMLSPAWEAERDNAQAAIEQAGQREAQGLNGPRGRPETTIKTDIIFRLVTPETKKVVDTNYDLGKWHVFIDTGIYGLLTQLNKYTKKAVRSIVLIGHGSLIKNKIQLDTHNDAENLNYLFTWADFYTFNNNPNNIINLTIDHLAEDRWRAINYFQQTIQKLTLNGNLVLLGCEAGDDLSKALAENIYKLKSENQNIKVYLNRDVSQSWPINKNNPKLKITYPNTGEPIPLTDPKDFLQGWLRYNDSGLFPMGNLYLIEDEKNASPIGELSK